MDANDRLREVNGRIEKRCKVCEEWKSIPSGFYINDRMADGFLNTCKGCVRDNWKRYYANLPADVKQARSDAASAFYGNRRAVVRKWLRGA